MNMLLWLAVKDEVTRISISFDEFQHNNLEAGFCITPKLFFRLKSKRELRT